MSRRSLQASFHHAAPLTRIKRVQSGIASSNSPIRKRSRLDAARVVTPDTSPSSAVSTRPQCKPIPWRKADLFAEEGFIDMEVPPNELRASASLTTGQCFNWTPVLPSANAVEKPPSSAWGTHDATHWLGVVTIQGETLALLIWELPTTTKFKTLSSPSHMNDDLVCASLRSYFQLETNLSALYSEWSGNCPRMRRIAACIPGMRIVDQDPWECLVSFLCSSNNNIPRITKMLSTIRKEYGRPLIQIQGEDSQDAIVYYSFPCFQDLLSMGSETDYREICGMGYRAKYLQGTIELLEDKGLDYLYNLREESADVVQDRLVELHGVGRKVADCIALFSLRQCDAIPVDVHVWNIARRDYASSDSDLAQLQEAKSITPRIYKMVGDLFRQRFQARSGWANSLLFVAELPSFRSVLPSDILEEMDSFRNEEKAKKKQSRENKTETRKKEKSKLKT